jgi:uncharacterized protein
MVTETPEIAEARTQPGLARRFAPPAAATLARLKGRKYILLTTFRKSGQPVATLVWFALGGDTLYITTAKDSGKVKRIRNNPQVLIAASTPKGEALGPAVAAVSAILPAAQEEPAARALRRKYGWLYRCFEWFFRLKGQEHIYLAIKLNEEGTL